MGFFTIPRIYHELKIDGKEVKDDEESVDYGADAPADDDKAEKPADNATGTDDDTVDYGADAPTDDEEDNTPATTDDNATEGDDDNVDYNLPENDDDTVDYGADAPTDDDVADDTGEDTEQPADNAGNEDDTVDYGADAPTDDEGDNPPAEADDNAGNKDDTVDYGSPDDGDAGDDAGNENEEDNNQDDGNNEETPDSTEDTGEESLKDIEAKLFSGLTPEQISIKQIELKTQYLQLYKQVEKLIDRINSINKNESNIAVLKYATKKLIEVRDILNFYITKTYDTKSYIENLTQFQFCLSILNTISNLIQELKINKKEAKENKNR